MDYPNGYNVPAFPAGKRLAISRFMGIGILFLVLALFFLACLLIWSVKSKKVDPFLISTNPITGEWNIVGHSHGEKEYSSYYALQNALINKFVQDWFFISDNQQENEELWKACDRVEDCANENYSMYTSKYCNIYCSCGENLFSSFTEYVLPVYQDMFKQGDALSLDSSSLKISPYGKVSQNGGAWLVQGKVVSDIEGEMNIIAFVKVARNVKFYPRTLGFYIADFNSYRL